MLNDVIYDDAVDEAEAETRAERRRRRRRREESGSGSWCQRLSPQRRCVYTCLGIVFCVLLALMVAIVTLQIYYHSSDDAGSVVDTVWATASPNATTSTEGAIITRTAIVTSHHAAVSRPFPTSPTGDVQEDPSGGPWGEGGAIPTKPPVVASATPWWGFTLRTTRGLGATTALTAGFTTLRPVQTAAMGPGPVMNPAPEGPQGPQGGTEQKTTAGPVPEPKGDSGEPGSSDQERPPQPQPTQLPQGPSGPQGPQGSSGPQGAPGQYGAPGSQGTPGFPYSERPSTGSQGSQGQPIPQPAMEGAPGVASGPAVGVPPEGGRGEAGQSGSDKTVSPLARGAFPGAGVDAPGAMVEVPSPTPQSTRLPVTNTLTGVASTTMDVYANGRSSPSVRTSTTTLPTFRPPPRRTKPPRRREHVGPHRPRPPPGTNPRPRPQPGGSAGHPHPPQGGPNNPPPPGAPGTPPLRPGPAPPQLDNSQPPPKRPPTHPKDPPCKRLEDYSLETLEGMHENRTRLCEPVRKMFKDKIKDIMLYLLMSLFGLGVIMVIITVIAVKVMDARKRGSCYCCGVSSSCCCCHKQEEDEERGNSRRSTSQTRAVNLQVELRMNDLHRSSSNDSSASSSADSQGEAYSQAQRQQPQYVQPHLHSVRRLAVGSARDQRLANRERTYSAETNVSDPPSYNEAVGLGVPGMVIHSVSAHLPEQGVIVYQPPSYEEVISSGASQP